MVLIRPSSTGFEVLLLRRHDAIAFMGGAHIFPGGSVDVSDRMDNPAAMCDGVAEAAVRLPGFPGADGVARYVAAVRELFEEAGVLLARRDRSMVAIEDRDADRFRAYRAGLADGRIMIQDVAERERLRLALDALVPFAHWVTPEIEIKRFDTLFFVAVAPERQPPIHDEVETTATVWLDPRDAVERCRRGTIKLPPPTWTTLRALERFASVDAVIEWARTRTLVPIHPVVVRDGDTMMLTLPGDARHPAPPGVDVPAETRFVLVEGRWQPL